MSSEVSREQNPEVPPVSSTPQRSFLKSLARWLPGILITSLAIGLLVRAINWTEFATALTSIPLSTLALVIGIYLLTLVLRAFAWQFLLQRKVTAALAFLAINEGYFFNNVLPFRIGELARAFLLGRRSGLGMFHILPTIVVERSYDLAIAAGLLLSTLPLALKLDWARPVAFAILAAIVLGLFAIYLAARNRTWVEERFERLAGRWGWVRRWIMPQLHAVLNGFSVLTRVEYFAGSFGLLALAWFVSIFRDWLLIRVFAPDAPFWWAALGISAANIIGAVPSVMASLGTFELGAVGALTLVGMSKEAVLAYALVIHIIHLIFSSLIGAYGLSREGKTIAELYADIRRAR